MEQVVKLVAAGLLILTLAGCAPVYYDDGPGYYAGYYERRRYRDYGRRYGRDYRDASYFQTEQYGVVDEHGDGWSRCFVHGRPAWCKVD